MFRRDYNDLVGIKNSVCGYFCKQSFTVVIKLGFDPVISRGSENGGKRGRLIIVLRVIMILSCSFIITPNLLKLNI